MSAALVAWVHSKKAVAVTTSSKRDRLERYLASADVKITDKEIQAFEAAAKKGPPSSVALLGRKINLTKGGKTALALLTVCYASYGLLRAGFAPAMIGLLGSVAGLTVLGVVYLVQFFLGKM